MTSPEAKAALLQRRADILGIRRDFSVAITADDLERMEHLNRLDLEARLAETDTARIRAIDAALQRIDEGSYGLCNRCEGQISPARLKALPEVSLCIRCAERAERRRA